MYKAIKDDKIIAISDTETDFPCLDKDEVVKDKKHTVEDYVMYCYDEQNAEYLLKSEVPAPTQEQQRMARQNAYVEEADPLRYDYEEDAARYGNDSEQALVSKETWLAKKDEIRERYPYPVEQ